MYLVHGNCEEKAIKPYKFSKSDDFKKLMLYANLLCYQICAF
jgi:hypothetical protein